MIRERYDLFDDQKYVCDFCGASGLYADEIFTVLTNDGEHVQACKACADSLSDGGNEE